jgi:multiple antibiotic resistance protein
MHFLKPYILSFIPLFVAIDALGNIPLFMALTEELVPKQKRRVIFESVTTALVLALAFMFLGKMILRVMGVTISDFKIAGGVLLFIISTYLLLPGRTREVFLSKEYKEIGIFPLGTPLITGPAVLTTILILVDSFGMIATFVSLILNILIIWFLFLNCDFVMRIFGDTGIRAFSKISDILLASIAIMLVRKGVIEIFFR